MGKFVHLYILNKKSPYQSRQGPILLTNIISKHFKHFIMHKLQKLIPNIYSDLAIYIEKELSKIDTLNFDMELTSNGFVLSDVDFPNDKYEVSNGDFYTFLYNTEFLQSEEEYNYFISSVGEDNEIQGQLEKFFYTEEATEEFCNGLTVANDSYRSCFKAVRTLSKSSPNIAPFPMYDVYKDAQRYLESVGEV